MYHLSFHLRRLATAADIMHSVHQYCLNTLQCNILFVSFVVDICDEMTYHLSKAMMRGSPHVPQHADGSSSWITTYKYNIKNI